MKRQDADMTKRQFGDVRRIVVKVGSAVIAGKGRLRPKIISSLAHDAVTLQHRGHEVVMVVSGAVAAGYHPLGMSRRPVAAVERHAAILGSTGSGKSWSSSIASCRPVCSDR